MGIRVQFVLKNPDAEKSCVMLLAYHKLFTDGRFRYYLPQIETKTWDPKRQRSKDKALNKVLEGLRVEMEAAFYRQWLQDQGVITSVWMQSQIDQLMGRTREIKTATTAQPADFFGIWEQVIDTAMNGDKPVTEGTKKSKRAALVWVKKYRQDTGWKPSLENIDREFYRGFTDYVSRNGITAVGKLVKEIKALCREAEDRGYNVNQDYKKKSFRVVNNPKDSVYLTLEDIQKIKALQLPKNLADVRDTFLMACFCGLRHSDWEKIHPKNIITTDGKQFLSVPTEKTGVSVQIPVHQVIREVMALHNERPPRVITNQKCNKYLKEIGRRASLGNVLLNAEIVDKGDCIKTHTARRTFATLAYLSGMAIELIMAITGHKTESSFRRYLKLGAQEITRLAANSKFFATETA